MEKILIVDDDLEILNLLKDIFEDEGFLVYTANDSNNAITLLKNLPDIILLDVMMPGKDGFSLCTEIRDSVKCPIIFLTAKTEEADIIKGLALGGDDYITKPFSVKEIRARVMAHLRRDKRKSNINKNFLMFNNLKIDLNSREVLYYDNLVKLTKREFDIIELLSLNSGQVFSKERIYEKIWGYDAEGDSSTVAEHIKKLRAKFQNINSNFRFIQTVWGVGYKWDSKEEGKAEQCLKSIL
ncbi:response regulator transcription factor [Clostridium baratii]|uniref:response regulator transcription factor n=1 Tax=Clostridium baratii TaxID=1561 RepID=UPI001CAEBD2D|nr:response regulator transcription factor [Clostridium baratii]STA99856.1 two-component response regulator [Clostridium baratii]